MPGQLKSTAHRPLKVKGRKVRIRYLNTVTTLLTMTNKPPSRIHLDAFHRDHAAHHLAHAAEGDVVDEEQIQIGLAARNGLVNHTTEELGDHAADGVLTSSVPRKRMSSLDAAIRMSYAPPSTSNLLVCTLK